MITEELHRIREIMQLNEVAGDPRVVLAKKFATFLERIISKAKTGEFLDTMKQQTNELSDIVSRIKTRGVNDLTEDELIKLFKAFDTGKLANLIFRENIIHPNIGQSLIDASKTIKSKQGYEDTLKNWKEASEIGWGAYPNGVPEELKPLYRDYNRKLTQELRNNIQTYNRSLWSQIDQRALKMSSLTDLLNRLPAENLNLLRAAYANLVTGQEKIEDRLAQEFDKLTRDYINAGGNVDFEPYAKRITQLAFSASKGSENNVKNFLEKQLDDANLSYDVRSLLRETDTLKHFNKLVTENPNKWKGLEGIGELVKRYMMLFNPKRFFKKMESGITGVPSLPKEQWQRFFNMILQLSPYTSAENVQRIASKGIWPVTALRLGAPSVLSFGVIPASAGLWNLFKGQFYEGMNYLSTNFGDGDPMFADYAEGGEMQNDMEGYFKEGFKSAFPKEWYRLIPGFQSLVDEIAEGIVAADSYQGGKKITSPELIAASKAGEALLKGETPNVDVRFLNEALKDVKKVVREIYSDIPEQILNNIKLYPDLVPRVEGTNPNGSPVAHKLVLKDNKIYVVDRNGRQFEFNKLW
jgi:hypothetical protein